MSIEPDVFAKPIRELTSAYTRRPDRALHAPHLLPHFRLKLEPTRHPNMCMLSHRITIHGGQVQVLQVSNWVPVLSAFSRTPFCPPFRTQLILLFNSALLAPIIIRFLSFRADSAIIRVNAHRTLVTHHTRSGVLSAMSSMVNLEVPWINIMTKMDLVTGKADDPKSGRNGIRRRRNIARCGRNTSLQLPSTKRQS